MMLFYHVMLEQSMFREVDFNEMLLVVKEVNLVK